MQFANRDPEFIKKRIAAMKDKKDNAGSGNRDFIFKEKVTNFQARDGENIVRLLPATWDDAFFPWYEAHIHYQIGANNGQFLCLARMLNKACPICEEAKKLADRNEPEEVVRLCYPQQRAIAYLIDRQDTAKGPQVWVMPFKKVAQEILTISFKRASGEAVFVDDVQEGWDIIFNKTGKLIKTQYSGVRKDDEPSILHTDEATMEKWLNQVTTKNIPSLLKFQSYEHIKAALYGTEPEATSDAPITSSTTKRKEKQEEVVEESTSTGIPVGEGMSLATLGALNRDGLVALINDRNLEVNADDWDDDDDLRQALSLELNLSE